MFVALSAMLEQSLSLVLAAAFLWGILSIVLSPCHISSSAGRRLCGQRFAEPAQCLDHLALFFRRRADFTTGDRRDHLDDGRDARRYRPGRGYLVGAVFVLTDFWLLDLFHVPACHLPMRSGQTALGGILMGFVFGAALGPCGFMFPVLAVVFRSAEQNPLVSVAIILSYAIGHSLVIVLAGVGVNQLQSFLNWDSKSARYALDEKALRRADYSDGFVSDFWQVNHFNKEKV